MSSELRSALRVGSEQIDEEHEHLISLVNKAEELLAVDQSVAALREAIDRLWEYTQDHFAREESIMINLGYARYDQHKKVHVELIEQLRLCTQPIREMGDALPDNTSQLSKTIRDPLKAFLRHGLVDHILKSDMQLKPLLPGRQQTLP